MFADMSRLEALLFSFAGVALMCGVGIALSYRSLAGAALLGLASFLLVGAGFIYKARKRRRKSE